MTRGHALLVMRYFGYLGMHTILKRKSSLARERLVDFTGELQVKCKRDKNTGGEHTKGKCPAMGETYILPPWRNQYDMEAASNGGRILTRPTAGGQAQEKTALNSFYAQEIAALPLERSVPEKSSSGRSKSSQRSKYDCMLLHRSFCNELICQPKMLQKCSKKNIAIKVELRELQWNEQLNAEIAVPVAPSIHNTRRGSWLVQEAFSSCAMGTPHFFDEFKIKLPLVLGASGHERIGLMFTVYQFKARRKRRSIMFSKQNDSNESENAYTIKQLGSGFLPLTLENSPTCLLANGDHDVPIKFSPVKPDDVKDKASPSSPQHRRKFSFGSLASSSSDVMEKEISRDKDESADQPYPEGSLALTKVFEPQTSHAYEDTQDDGNTDDGSSKSHVTDGSTCRSSRMGMRSISSTGDLQRLGSRGSQSSSSPKDSVEVEMVLRVNVIAFSSVHPQNKPLAELFITKPKQPRSLVPSDFSEPYAPWGKFRSEILYRLKPERIPPFNFVGGALAETERKSLEPVISLTKSSKCPHSDLMTHLVRVVAQLWRTAVSGAGEPSILWAR